MFKTASGSGFVIKDKDTGKRYVVTNYHVIGNFIDIECIFGAEKYETDVYMVAPQYDIALLNFPSKGTFCHISIGKSTSLTTDKKVYAAGFPLGMKDMQVSQGFKTGNYITDKERYIEHSAALNPGNSGGTTSCQRQRLGLRRRWS